MYTSNYTLIKAGFKCVPLCFLPIIPQRIAQGLLHFHLPTSSFPSNLARREGIICWVKFRYTSLGQVHWVSS